METQEKLLNAIREWKDYAYGLADMREQLEQFDQQRRSIEFRIEADVQEDSIKEENAKVLKTVAQRETEVGSRLGRDEKHIDIKNKISILKKQIGQTEIEVRYWDMMQKAYRAILISEEGE